MTDPTLNPEMADAIDADRDRALSLLEFQGVEPIDEPALCKATEFAQALDAADPGLRAGVPSGLVARAMARIQAESSEESADSGQTSRSASTPTSETEFDAPAPGSGNASPALSQRQAALLDAWLEDAEGKPAPIEFEGFDRLMQTGLGSIALGSVPPALVGRSLDRIKSERRAADLATQIDRFRGNAETLPTSVAGRIGFGGRLRGGVRQVLAAAALLFIGSALLLPALSKSAMEAGRLACMGNLRAAGSAFAQYAADHGGVLPRVAGFNALVPAGLLGEGGVIRRVSQSSDLRRLVEPGAEPSTGNSRHLGLLVQAGGGYIDSERLICHGTPLDASETAEAHRNLWQIPGGAGYSYQSQASPEALRLEHARPGLGLLSDRSPLFSVRNGRLERRNDVPITHPSRIHLREGQNLLTADGSALWTIRPRAELGCDAGDQAQADRLWVSDRPASSTSARLLFVPTDITQDTVLVP